MDTKIIDLKAYDSRNKINKDEVINYILKSGEMALQKLFLTKEDVSILDKDSVYLDVNGEVVEFSNISVVDDKVSGRIKVGQYSDMLDYFNTSYDVYNTAYKKTGIDSFKVNRDDLFIVELPNCQAMIDAMWGTDDWVCKLIGELRGSK